MKFVALVISLLLERVLGKHERWRSPEWFRRYADWMHGTFGRYGPWAGPAGVLAVAAVPAVAVGVVYALLGGALLSLLALVFSVVVLLFSLGPRELDAQAGEYLAALEAGDTGRAEELARGIAGPDAAGDGAAGARRVAEAVLTEFNDRTFAVIFWFVVLGPLGAILYRCASLMRTQPLPDMAGAASFHEAAARLQGILAWLPARLLVLGFALAGSFEDTITDWKAYYERSPGRFWEVNDEVIVTAGRGALRLGESSDDAGASDVRAALALVLRTLVVWLVLLGLLAITGFTL